MKTLFLVYASIDELINFSNDLEHLFIKKLILTKTKKPSLNLPTTLKTLFIESINVNLDSVKLDNNFLSKSDFGIREKLFYKLPFGCKLHINNCCFFNSNVVPPFIKDLSFVFGVKDFDMFGFNDEQHFIDEMVINGKWTNSVENLNELVEINYSIINKDIMPTVIVYPVELQPMIIY